MSDVAQRLGQQIRTLRIARGLSQEELAARSGLHVQTLSRIERGTTKTSFEHAVAIATGLEVSAATFCAPFMPKASQGNDALMARLRELGPENYERAMGMLELFLDAAEVSGRRAR